MNDIVAINTHSFYITKSNYYDPDSILGFAEAFLKRPWVGVQFCNFTLSSVYKVGKQQAKGRGRCETIVDGLVYANGINKNNDDASIIMVTQTLREVLSFYRRHQNGSLELVHQSPLPIGCDNIDVDEQSGEAYIACHPQLLKFTSHAFNHAVLSPSQVVRLTGFDGVFKHKFKEIDDSDTHTDAESSFHSVTQNVHYEEVYLSDGEALSAVSVMAKYGKHFLLGSVFQEGVLHCVL